MRILLIKIDGNMPNLALHKIERYHLNKGDEVFWNQPELREAVDKIYVSVLMDYNRKKVKRYEKLGAEIGGSGYDLKKRLPPEIHDIKPRINLGYTTRGCNRRCPFCVVHVMEGSLRIVGDIYDLWNRKDRLIKLIDNNILQAKDHFYKIYDQLKKENLIIDFCQGLDAKLVNNEIALMIANLKHVEYIKFAWDNMEDEDIILSKLAIMKKHVRARRLLVYILCGYNTTFKQDVYRKEKLKSLGYEPYVMVYHKKSSLLNHFARWTNRFMFRNISFEKYLEISNYQYLLEEKNESYNIRPTI